MTKLAPAVGLDQLTINTIRTLSMDAVQAADSGHPGTPMALAPVAYTLWHDVLRYDPQQPLWPNRDRFVLSCGHASMLLYATLHLAGVRQLDAAGRVTDQLAVPLEDIRRFRQWESRCPGHPEHGHTSGVETTTGPLGQGIGNSVGMAIAERYLAARYNQPGFELFGYRTYALCSDGDLMEGVGSEAASLAGHLKLSNLCWIYDDNHITIDGKTDLSFSEQVGKRFAGYGWHVIHVADANDLAAVRSALDQAQQTTDRPTLVVVRSVIAWGAPSKQGTSAAHGAPLGEEEIRRTKSAYGWDEAAKFLVPDGVTEDLQGALAARGGKAAQVWQTLWQRYQKEHAQAAAELQHIFTGTLPTGWDKDIPTFPADAKGIASRDSSGKVLNTIAPHMPWLIGGAADLASSTKTTLKGEQTGDFSAETPQGKNLHFGIREHAMGACLNGMALSGLRAYGSTFLVFSDYVRPSMRLSAIMGVPVIYVFTHDSIGVGEDGPTHQPIEHLAALRAIPNMVVIRPGDANEVAEAWRSIIPLSKQPVSLILTRQNLPTLDRSKYASAEGARRGAYVLADAKATLQVILLATGSELSLAVEAYEQLTASGIGARVVSMPSWELFEAQDAAYREQVLPSAVTARVAIEAGIEQGWQRYLGSQGRFIGMSHYGASAPIKELYRHFGLTTERLVSEAKNLLGK
jgi:transketolase